MERATSRVGELCALGRDGADIYGDRTTDDEARETDFGAPVINKPHWKWLVVVYFFLGGIAGATYVVAPIAGLVGGAEGRRIARGGRFVSLAGLLLAATAAPIWTRNYLLWDRCSWPRPCRTRWL